jgi:hypothetical protein
MVKRRGILRRLSGFSITFPFVGGGISVTLDPTGEADKHRGGGGLIVVSRKVAPDRQPEASSGLLNGSWWRLGALCTAGVCAPVSFLLVFPGTFYWLLGVSAILAGLAGLLVVVRSDRPVLSGLSTVVFSVMYLVAITAIGRSLELSTAKPPPADYWPLLWPRLVAAGIISIVVFGAPLVFVATVVRIVRSWLR